MVVSGTLYTYADSFRGFKCQIAANCSGADVKVVTVNPADRSQQHVPNFLSTDKKVKLFDDNAIAFYLACEQGRGSTVEDKAFITQWVNWSATVLSGAVASWTFPAISLVDASAESVEQAKAELKRCFTFLNEQLKTRTFLATERITLADVTVATDLMLAMQHVCDAEFRGQFGNVMRWWNTIVNQEPFKKATGQITLCTKTAEFNSDKFAENKAAQVKAPKAQEKKPKADKPKPKPAEKKKPEPKEEEDETFAEERPDPFSAFPKGTYNMDEFKRTYSNADTETVAIPYFFKTFEPEFYSIWMCEYKYPKELGQIFMTSNLVGGMFQRIEKMRKNSFASMCVFGDNSSNTIAGCWFWKGHELAFPLCPDWCTDYESYEWRKMDITNAEDIALIKMFWLHEGEFKGQKFNQGKIFK